MASTTIIGLRLDKRMLLSTYLYVLYITPMYYHKINVTRDNQAYVHKAIFAWYCSRLHSCTYSSSHSNNITVVDGHGQSAFMNSQFLTL